MFYLYLVLLVLINSIWLTLVFFGLPGHWFIIISTALFTWWQWERHPFSLYTLIAIIILALTAELIEFISGVAGAKKAGASARFAFLGTITGAVIGAILGTILIPIPLLGTIIGSCLGAGVGSWILEVRNNRTAKQALRTGVGAGLGQFLGITTKIILGIFIWLITTLAAFWP